MTRKLTPNDLSDSACFALAYAQALIGGKGSVAEKRYLNAQQKLRMSSKDQQKAISKGLAELRELGIIECQRDGMGDLVPTVLHEEKLQPNDGGPRLVTGDLN